MELFTKGFRIAGRSEKVLIGFLRFGRHLLSRQEEELRVLRIHSTQKPAKPTEKSCVLARMPPSRIVPLALRESSELGRLLVAIIEELV